MQAGRDMFSHCWFRASTTLFIVLGLLALLVLLLIAAIFESIELDRTAATGLLVVGILAAVSGGQNAGNQLHGELLEFYDCYIQSLEGHFQDRIEREAGALLSEEELRSIRDLAKASTRSGLSDGEHFRAVDFEWQLARA